MSSATIAAAQAAAISASPAVLAAFRPVWHTTALRVKDATAAVRFYTEELGFRVVHTRTTTSADAPGEHVDDDVAATPAPTTITRFYLQTWPEGYNGAGDELSSAQRLFGSAKADAASASDTWPLAVATDAIVSLELVHTHGTEEASGDVFSGYHSGNSDPRGFGHVAVNASDVSRECTELEQRGADFKKRPDEGRMKGLAFVFDADRYWVEVVPRSPAGIARITPKFNFSQTMLRVADPTASLAFYTRVLGMTLVCERHFDASRGDFSLYFLASGPLPAADAERDPNGVGVYDAGRALDSDAAFAYMKSLYNPVLELTWNHGTERTAAECAAAEAEVFAGYHNGSTGPLSHRGFAHTSFVVDDLASVCATLDAKAGEHVTVAWARAYVAGAATAVVFDPDGYRVQFVQRGGKLSST